MSPAAAFHAQLASIMEVLANTAVAEICELVDNSYSVLQLEISRSRKENEVLRRKLRLMELRAARATALRAAVTAGGSALLLANSRARTQPPSHPSDEPKRNGTPRVYSEKRSITCHDHNSSTPSNQEAVRRGSGLSSDRHDDTRVTAAAGESVTTAVIKVEDGDGSWSQTEQDREFCPVVDGQRTETEAPPLPIKQEVAAESDLTHGSWMSGDISSSQNQRSENDSYLRFEPQLHVSTHNPLSEEPSCSYTMNSRAGTAADGSSSFPFTTSVAEHQQPAGFQDNQQRAPLPEDQPQLPARKDAAARQTVFIRRGRGRHQDGVGWAHSHSRGDSRATFVCNCCGKSLACLKNLKTHMRVHTGEKPFVCALCGKCFSDSSNLKRHQSVHTGEKRYGCVHCGKRFAQSGSLKVHMTVHTDCKQFKCSFCGKTFISGSHLRRHAAVHSGEK